MKKHSVMWFMLALLSILAAANICWAVEEDEDGNIRQSQPLALEGDDSVAPKPKVIIKERVVMKCAPGTIWSPKNKRCISEDGEAPPPPRYQAPRQQAAAAPSAASQNDRYVHPSTKLRIKIEKCTMVGETVTCVHSITNTAQGSTRVFLKGSSISDDLGETYKVQSSDYYYLDYGETKKYTNVYPLVNTAASTVLVTLNVSANGGTDLVRFAGVSLIK